MALADTLSDLLLSGREQPAQTVAGARILASDDASQRATAICAELNETMLARKLTFRSEAGAELVLDAGARRLLRVLKVEPEALAPSQTVFQSRDDAKIANQIKALGALLGEFAALDGRVSVTVEHAEGSYSEGGIGFMPDRLADIARTTAMASAAAAAEAAATAAANEASKASVSAKAAPAPAAAAALAADAGKKMDPTAAMKALIREKIEAAAAAKAAAKDAPPAAAPARRSTKTSDSRIRSFFGEVEGIADFCAILNADGNVEAVAGSGKDDQILNFGADIVADLTRWRGFTANALSRTQIVVMRAGGIQNQSMATFADDYGVVIVIFANTDLSRIFMIANKVMGPIGGA